MSMTTPVPSATNLISNSSLGYGPFTGDAGSSTSKTSSLEAARTYEMSQLSERGNQAEEEALTSPSAKPSSSPSANRFLKSVPIINTGLSAVATTALVAGAVIRHVNPNTEADRVCLAATGLFTIIPATLAVTHDILNKPQLSVARKVAASLPGAVAAVSTSVLSVAVSQPDADARRLPLYVGGGLALLGVGGLMLKEAFVPLKGKEQQQKNRQSSVKKLVTAETVAYGSFALLSVAGVAGGLAAYFTDRDDFGRFKNEAVAPALALSLGFLAMHGKRFLGSMITEKSLIPPADTVSGDEPSAIADRV